MTTSCKIIPPYSVLIHKMTAPCMLKSFTDRPFRLSPIICGLLMRKLLFWSGIHKSAVLTHLCKWRILGSYKSTIITHLRSSVSLQGTILNWRQPCNTHHPLISSSVRLVTIYIKILLPLIFYGKWYATSDQLHITLLFHVHFPIWLYKLIFSFLSKAKWELLFLCWTLGCNIFF